MATPARFRDAMSAVGGIDIPPKALKATELRLAGNANAREGDLQAAVANYTEASWVGNAVRGANPPWLVCSCGPAFNQFTLSTRWLSYCHTATGGS